MRRGRSERFFCVGTEGEARGLSYINGFKSWINGLVIVVIRKDAD
ncbi:hypothetical protein [Bartonella sp. TT119HLJHH]